MEKRLRTDEDRILNFDHFNSQIRQQATCSICSYIFTDPVQCTSCKGILCSYCAKGCDICPLSSCMPLTTESIPLSLKETLNSVIILCEINNCEVPLLDYEKHKQLCHDGLINTNNEGQILNDPSSYQTVEMTKNYNLAINNNTEQLDMVVEPGNEGTNYEDQGENNLEAIQENDEEDFNKEYIDDIIQDNVGNVGNIDENGKKIVYLCLGVVVPKLDATISVFVLIFNLFTPGLGTILIICCNNEKNYPVSVVWMCIALLQIITAPFIFGFVHAIGLSCLLIKLSDLNEYDEDFKELFNSGGTLKISDNVELNDETGPIIVKYSFRNIFGAPLFEDLANKINPDNIDYYCNLLEVNDIENGNIEVDENNNITYARPNNNVNRVRHVYKSNNFRSSGASHGVSH